VIEGGDANDDGDRERPMDPGRDRLYIASLKQDLLLWRKSIMKTKILILVLALVLAAAFCFARGKKEEAAPKAAPGIPQYGGTLTILHQRCTGDPPSPAQGDCQVEAIDGWLAAIQEHALLGNVQEYGGMGNGEFMFEYSDYIPWKYVTGHLIESWEVTPERAVLHVRPGIKWAPTEEQKAWMPVRELTAEDIAFDINFFRHASWGSRFDGVLKDDVYTTDKYTVICEFENFSNQFMYYIGFEDRAVYSPPELEKNSPNLWKNQVGTGPFMFKEYQIGAFMKFTRNPDYWNKTTIKGKEYQMPFVDELVFPIIPDASTQMAAIRTGKVDLQMEPQIGQWDNYDSISPNLVSHTCAVGSGMALGLNCKKPPFDKKTVRQAVTIGTDMHAFAKYMRSDDQPIRFHPSSSKNPTVFVPDNELPEEIRALYNHDPAKAKKMLADAGYPKGFKTSIYCRNIARDQDVAAMVKDQWTKIGIDADIVVMDPSPLAKVMYAVEYDGALVATIDAANPIIVLSSEGKTGAWYNFSGWSNTAFDEIMTALEREIDIDKQNRMCKEGALLMMAGAPYLPLAPRVVRAYWWRWLNNYYGEFSLSDGAIHQLLPYMWIDQDLKKELGF
jgi:peptide/nickel transport system substrate-binding protein